MKTIAIIPARAGSKRLPGKNVRSFLGTPLIMWSIRFAIDLGLFDHIVVSTDSEEIADLSRSTGIDVPYLRPAALASDTASSAEVVADIVVREARSGRTYEALALLQPTSPIREPSRWREAFSLMDDSSIDAAIGVAPAHTHPFQTFRREAGGHLQPFIDREGLRLRGQDLPEAVAVAGNMYLVRSSAFERDQSFFPARTVGILCDQPYEALDIDTEADWVAAEALARYYVGAP